MALEDLLRRPITGIRPFNELPIDADIWRQAHAHHHSHRYVHGLSAHRPGIVYGLEVLTLYKGGATPSSKAGAETRSRTIMVAPGVAIDGNGNTLVLREKADLQIDEARQIYITLSFQKQADKNAVIQIDGTPQYFREVEGSDLVTSQELPKDRPYIELARIFRTDNSQPIRDAENPFAPANNELNLLFRPIAFPFCYADVGVGELSYVPTSGNVWNPNRAGLFNLLREGNGRGFHLQFTGPISLNADAGQATDPAMLYVAGSSGWKPLADTQVEGLKSYLDKGGLLIGEAKQGNSAFEADFKSLAQRLGAVLQPVAHKPEQKHPLLTAHHIFSCAPCGAQTEGALLADVERGIVYSTMDFGGAWQGDLDRPDDPNARERVRTAVEFGLNLIVYSASRRRNYALKSLMPQ